VDHLPNKEISYYPNIKDLLSATTADVICICTPNYLHAEQAIVALDAGKHVVVEKPMALSTAECDAMIAAADRNHRVIFAVKQNRYNPPVAAVKELLTSGRLGKIYMMQVNCFWNRSDNYYAQSDWRGTKEKDGGCLFTQFSHFIDILYYLNGTITEANGFLNNFAHTHNTEFEDSGIFSMKAANGTIINFNFSTCAYEKNMEGSITILAEKGTLKIGGQYLNTLEYQCLEGEELPHINIVAKENDYGLYKGSMSNHDKVIQNVVEVLNHNMPVMTGAEEGKDVIGIIELMYANAR
jgi:predicted dehydrogenase